MLGFPCIQKPRGQLKLNKFKKINESKKLNAGPHLIYLFFNSFNLFNLLVAPGF
jgi:hypothetical protein